MKYHIPHEIQSLGFLRRLLKEYSEKHPRVSEFSFKNYGMLGEFTKNGHYFGRYTLRTKAPLNNLVKPIYKPSCIKAAFHHNQLTCGTNYNFDSKDIRMNHYWGARLQGFVGPLSEDIQKKTVEDLGLLPILNRIYEDAIEIPKQKITIFTMTSPRPSHPNIDIINETLHSMYYYYPNWVDFKHYIVLDGCPTEVSFWESKWCGNYKPFYNALTTEISSRPYFANIQIIQPESWSERVGLTASIQHAFRTTNVHASDVVFLQQSGYAFYFGRCHIR